MDVTQITSPAFLKDLDAEQCQELADSIRTFIIENVAKTGGHLSSNLGTVELTIALHKEFNSPQDKIFFDVGHQSYTHKILTGRAKDFTHLRQYQGMNGFEDRRESLHDVWEAGHSSTSLSGALGMAIARDLHKEDYYIVPVIGDGAMSSGMAMEALNEIGDEQKKKMIIIFNDNNMSITKNVGALTRSFARLRTSKGYNDMKDDMKNVLNRNLMGQTVLKGLRNVRDAVKGTVVDKGIFGEFNMEYIGPVDGHNIPALLNALDTAKKQEEPVVVHVITTKGKGYKYCETDKTGTWHGVSPFDVETGEFNSVENEKTISWSQQICRDLCKLAETNPDIVCLTPAMISGSKLEEFFAKYPERSFDCGIAEEHATTMAAGLAINGCRPFLDVYSSFLQRSFDQVVHDICRMDLPVVLGIDRAGLVGEDGATHHGIYDISMLRMIPNMILTQPKDAEEAFALMKTAFGQKHPFAIRFPRGAIRKDNTYQAKALTIGSWTVFHEEPHNKAVVFTYGPDVDRLLGKVMINNLPVTIVNCRFFKPLDEACLEHFYKQDIKLICYETDTLTGGLSSALLEWANDHGYEKPLERKGIQDHFVTFGSTNRLRVAEGIDLESVVALLEKDCQA